MNNKLMITFDKLELDPELRERTRGKIYHRACKRNTWMTKLVSSAAVILCAILCIHAHSVNMRLDYCESTAVPDSGGGIMNNPFADFPDDSVESFIYNNHYYILVETSDYNDVEKLLDRELGVTTSDGLNSMQDRLEPVDLSTLPDFTCIRPDMRIYSVKGCDEDFRLAGIAEGANGKKQARIYEAPFALTNQTRGRFFWKASSWRCGIG